MSKKIAVMGTGVVGKTIGSKLIQLGYQVMMGSRTAENEKALEWVAANGSNATNGTFSDAGSFGEVVFNCTKGEHTKDVFRMAGIENFNGKTIVDISNGLDFSQGMPPSLYPQWSNTNSLGEELQNLMPAANIVKSLNIVTAEVMVDARKSGGDPTMFVSGNHADAKAETMGFLNQFGWTDIMDLGDITTARGTEMMLPVWLRIYMAGKSPYFGFKIVRPS